MVNEKRLKKKHWIYLFQTFFYKILAEPPGVAPVEKKCRWWNQRYIFLYVPADLKVYYLYILVHKKGGGGVNAFVGNG